MKALAIASSLALAAAAVSADRSGASVVALRAAVDLAGAWANDGFKLRDGHCTGTLQPGKPHVVQVNLIEGNRYWFTASTAPNAGLVSVSIFDESGQPISAETYQDGARAAAGFAPAVSGPYLVKLEQTGSHPSTFCLVYSYK